MYQFPVAKEDLNKVLATALERGGEYADIFMEHSAITSLELQDGVVSQSQQCILYGAGIRTLCAEKTGYAYSMDLSQEALLQAAKFAGSVGLYGEVNPRRVPSLSVNVPSVPDLTEAVPFENEKSRQILLSIDQKAHERDSRVVRVKAAITQRIQDIWFVNSEGVSYMDQRPRSVLFLTIVMEQNGQTQMGFSSRMAQMDAQFLSDALIDDVLGEALSRTSFLFDAVQLEGGEMPVVMAAGASGILMHEAIGHAFEADFNRTGDSIFSGKMGQRICDSSISIVDDGTLPGDAGYLRYDDEGVAGQRTVLVDHGVLNSYLHDRITARHYGVAPTGNGRRESFRCMPLPRMRSTYMLGGDVSEEDIIRSVKRGVYAQTFTNGQVQIGAGDFTFYMKQGYLIEDGHLTQPIRDMNIIGNGPQALQRISMVGNNLKIDHSASMCGKGGQSVPVSQGLPSVLIDKLVVG